MTNDLSRARTSSTANGRNNSSPVSRSAASNSSDRYSKGYSRIKSGEHKRRGVTRSPNMSNPNARAAKADLSLGSLPMTAPVKKMAVPVASVRTEPTVRTVTDTTKVSFPYSVVFLSLLCSLLFFYMIFNYVQINEHTSAVSDLKSEIATLSFEADDLSAKLDIKNDLTLIEKIAKEKLGMVTVDEVTKKYITMDPGDTIDPSKK